MNRISFLNCGYAFKGLLAVRGLPWRMKTRYGREDTQDTREEIAERLSKQNKQDKKLKRGM